MIKNELILSFQKLKSGWQGHLWSHPIRRDNDDNIITMLPSMLYVQPSMCTHCYTYWQQLPGFINIHAAPKLSDQLSSHQEKYLLYQLCTCLDSFPARCSWLRSKGYWSWTRPETVKANLQADASLNLVWPARYFVHITTYFIGDHHQRKSQIMFGAKMYH